MREMYRNDVGCSFDTRLMADTGFSSRPDDISAMKVPLDDDGCAILSFASS
jgi:hypothetical protein